MKNLRQLIRGILLEEVNNDVDITSSLRNFDSEYRSMCKRNPIGYPGDRYWYMGEIDGKYCLVITNLSIDEQRGLIQFNSIQTVPPEVCEGQGYASQVMDTITGLADKHGVSLRLDVKPFGQKSLEEEDLESWYRKAGFESGDSDYENTLIRKPLVESIPLDVKVGDVILTGRFKNRRTVIKSIGKDKYGHPTINGKSILKFKIEKNLPKKKWSAKSREALEESAHSGQVEYIELDSPLKYSRYTKVKRIAYCDRSVTEPEEGSSTYFKEKEKWRKYSKGRSRKKLKKPVLEEIIPGVSDVCIIGFLDYHKDWDSSEGWLSYPHNGWYIDYMNTRGDLRDQKIARKLVEYFYENIVEEGDAVDWGKMMHPAIGHLKNEMVEKYPGIKTRGARYY